MKIKIDSDGYVTGYAEVGDIVGGAEYNGVIPDDLAQNIGFYRFDGKSFTLDAEKKKAADTAAANAEKIADLLAQLAATDYIAAKLAEAAAEAAVSGDNTPLSDMLKNYAYIISDRQTWREEIDGLKG